MGAVKRVNILGCPCDAISFRQTVDRIKHAVLADRTLHVVTANVDFVMKARQDPVFAAELWRADLVVADGVPIVWAAALLGTPIQGRVSGCDLAWSCAGIAVETGASMALIGARPGVAHRAAQKMQERYPGATLHAIPTPFPLGHDDTRALVQHIKDLNAGIVLAALGTPRQERWLQAHLGACGAHVGIGVGSALDIISGYSPRAPVWMQDYGLEWFHRMLQEPRRLGKRYLIEDSPFLFHLARELVRKKI